MNNIPKIKVGLVAVSRDCFPAPLAVNRRKAVAEAYAKKYDANDIYECPITIVESEIDMVNALEDIKKNGCNALCVYLGNFGPEISETLLAKHFDGPKMFCAAAEESQNTLGVQGRGDAYCGMLNASYNLALRNVNAYIQIANAEFVSIDNKNLKFVVGSDSMAVYNQFGVNTDALEVGEPANFLACNAPIKQLYNLNVEIEEESELDLFEAYEKHYCPEKYHLDAAVVEKQNKEIADIKADMMKELNITEPTEKQADMLQKFAAYEATLVDWVEANKGYRKYVALTTKCWPAFEDMFNFVPCYVNSRLTGRGIPVSCEVDIYGTLSEYIGLCISEQPVTLLDINNSVPKDMYKESIEGKFDYKFTDTFMGFHCGNTCSAKLVQPHIGYQKIMANTHPRICGRGRGPSGCDKVLRFDRRLRNQGNGPLLSLRADRKELSASRRRHVRQVWQVAL